MGVNLRVVGHTTGREAEGARGPCQIIAPGFAAQRQAFADGGFINLDDANASGFQVADFIAYGKRDLFGGGGARLVVTHEGPLQDGDGAGEHGFHRLLRQALGVAAPGHRHGLRARYVAEDDGRLDAARAIRLHPAVAGKAESGQLLAEVFDHVVALGFAVHEHVDAQFFLFGDGVGDFFLHHRLIFGGGERAALEGCARGADFGGLREGTNRRRRQRRQGKTLALRRLTRREGRMALVGVGRQSGQPLRYGGVVDALAVAARFDGGARGGQRAIGGGVTGQRLFEHAQLAEFFHRKGHPAAQFFVQTGFPGKAEGHMQQRARGRQPQVFAAPLKQRAQRLQRGIQIAAPDVATINDAQREHLVRGQPVVHRGNFRACADAVDVQTLHRQAAGHAEVLLQGRKIGGQQQRGLAGRQRRIRRFKRLPPLRRQIQTENRFIHLHPLHALRFEAGENLTVDRQQLVEQAEAVKTRRLFLAEPQEGQGAKQHRLDRMPQRLRLRHFRKQTLVGQRKFALRRKFGHQIVIVGIEPLGHFQRRRALRAGADFAGNAARQREIACQRRLRTVKTKTRRLAAKQLNVVGDVVVPGEIAHGDKIQPGLALHLPVARAQLTADGFQLVGGNFAAPVAFQRKLQFAVRAHARKTQSVNRGHENGSKKQVAVLYGQQTMK